MKQYNGTPNTTAVESSGMMEQKGYTIQSTPHAFAVLSGGYTNQVRAIIRELICNASDSMVSAGKGEQPITVHLPCAIDPTFYVEDNGTGMDHETVLQVYSTYFYSTKQDTNDEVGLLGLGSKSPFCYTDSFTLVSRYEGMERVYFNYLDDERKPCISLMDEHPTTRSNGVKVEFSVEVGEHRRWEREFYEVIKPLSVKPRLLVNGEEKELEREWADYKTILSGDGWEVIERHQGATALAIQGSVAYPVDSDQSSLTEKFSDQNLVSFFSSFGTYDMPTLVVRMPIGSFNFTPFRDSIVYDERTTYALASKIESALREVVDSIVATIQPSGDETLTELWHNWNSSSISSHFGRGDIEELLEWDDKKIQIDSPYISINLQRSGYQMRATRNRGYTIAGWRERQGNHRRMNPGDATTPPAFRRSIGSAFTEFITSLDVSREIIAEGAYVVYGPWEEKSHTYIRNYIKHPATRISSILFFAQKSDAEKITPNPIAIEDLEIPRASGVSGAADVSTSVPLYARLNELREGQDGVLEKFLRSYTTAGMEVLPNAGDVNADAKKVYFIWKRNDKGGILMRDASGTHSLADRYIKHVVNTEENTISTEHMVLAQAVEMMEQKGFSVIEPNVEFYTVRSYEMDSKRFKEKSGEWVDGATYILQRFLEFLETEKAELNAVTSLANSSEEDLLMKLFSRPRFAYRPISSLLDQIVERAELDGTEFQRRAAEIQGEWQSILSSLQTYTSSSNARAAQRIGQRIVSLVQYAERIGNLSDGEVQRYRDLEDQMGKDRSFEEKVIAFRDDFITLIALIEAAEGMANEFYRDGREGREVMYDRIASLAKMCETESISSLQSDGSADGVYTAQ